MKFCLDCENDLHKEDYEIGVWRVLIRKKYRGTYGKFVEPLCSNCIILAIEGYHTGGGLTASCILMIRRLDK